MNACLTCIPFAERVFDMIPVNEGKEEAIGISGIRRGLVERAVRNQQNPNYHHLFSYYDIIFD